jgi:hypothetical protein
MYAAVRFSLLFGIACMTMVVLTHIAEAFGMFPGMGWGLPNSAGHYLDLMSALLGCVLLPIGIIGILMMRRQNSN